MKLQLLIVHPYADGYWLSTHDTAQADDLASPRSTISSMLQSAGGCHQCVPGVMGAGIGRTEVCAPSLARTDRPAACSMYSAKYPA